MSVTFSVLSLLQL